MTDGTSAPVSAQSVANTASPKKAKKSTKGKSTHHASHPKYSDMIKAALKSLNDRSGSSRAAILKYVLAHYSIDPMQANQHLKLALKNGVKSKSLKQTKGNGASGSFKIGTEAKPAKKKSSKKAKKPSSKGTKKRSRSKSAGTKSAKKVATAANTNNSATAGASTTTTTAAPAAAGGAKPKKVKVVKPRSSSKSKSASGKTKKTKTS